MDINWGTGGAVNLGRIPDSDIRVERVRDQDKKLYFLLSDSQWTYLYCDDRRYDNLQDMEAGVFEYLKRKGRI